MKDPLVTVGVPAFRGGKALPALLECLRTQSYGNIDVLISIDGADTVSAESCEPFLRHDPRFRMRLQPSRLGWAGNTHWTMRERRGDFYIYQQHDDLVSPTYIADLVEAAARWPNAAICFSKIKLIGLKESEVSAPSLLGVDRIARALKYLRRLDWVPFRGLIRSSALAATDGLLLSSSDPFDSFGTELRLMTQLALAGEFRFVAGPTYLKFLHGENVSGKRRDWSNEQETNAYACLCAWMIEVIATAGATLEERIDLFWITFGRFAGQGDLADWVAAVSLWMSRADSPHPNAPLFANRLRAGMAFIAAAPKHASMGDGYPRDDADLRRKVFACLRNESAVVPEATFGAAWDTLESAGIRVHAERGQTSALTPGAMR